MHLAVMSRTKYYKKYGVSVLSCDSMDNKFLNTPVRPNDRLAGSVVY